MKGYTDQSHKVALELEMLPYQILFSCLERCLRIDAARMLDKVEESHIENNEGIRNDGNHYYSVLNHLLCKHGEEDRHVHLELKLYMLWCPHKEKSLTKTPKRLKRLC